MPIYRQLPKRGFKNPFRKSYGILNVGTLNEVEIEGTFDLAMAQSKGLVRKRDKMLKILAEGEISKAVTVKVHAISQAAREKIEAAGGTVELIETGKGE